MLAILQFSAERCSTTAARILAQLRVAELLDDAAGCLASFRVAEHVDGFSLGQLWLGLAWRLC